MTAPKLRLMVFTPELDAYSEQLLHSLIAEGCEVFCVVAPQAPDAAARWDTTLNVVALVPLRGRLDAHAAARYAELITTHRPDVCLCYTSRALSVALKARRSARLHVPLIGTRGAVGGLSALYVQDWFSYLNPDLDCVVCFSEAIRHRLQREARRLWKAHPGHFVTIYQGYASLLNSAVKRDHLQRAAETVRVIATIANERPIKGMKYLLDALEHHVQADHWRLLWIGAVSEPTRRRIAASPRLAQRVTCTGFRKDARALIAASDLYVQPTIAPGEGIGNGIAEAMAAEVPVATSNVGGALELVGAVSAQLLFEPADAVSLGQTLDRLLQAPALCEDLGRAGAQVLADRFRLDTETQQYLDLFRRLLARPRGPRS